MLDPGIERFGRWVFSEAEDLAAADPGHAARPGDEQEAQGTHAAHHIRVSALARAAAGRRDGVELEAAGHVVGEHAELLPRTVGGVVAGRDDIERELALQLPDGLFLGTAGAA